MFYVLRARLLFSHMVFGGLAYFTYCNICMLMLIHQKVSNTKFLKVYKYFFLLNPKCTTILYGVD